jgi:hypothetical protein
MVLAQAVTTYGAGRGFHTLSPQQVAVLSLLRRPQV